MSEVQSHGKGVVACGHPSVTAAAARVLREGGNAVDAAIAAGFASAMAEPALTSLGGGGFLLARGVEGSAILFDFFVDTPGRGLPPGDLEPHFLPVTVHFPGSDQVFNTGLGSAAVPGNLKGYLHAHERLGRLPLREVLAPAIGLARKGVRLNRHQAYFLELLRPILTLTPAGRSLFEPNGSYLGEGDCLVNLDLASFLEDLPADRGRDFYSGAVAERIGRDMGAGGGMLTREDLASFRVVERAPLEVRYRSHRLLTNPPPSVGGSLIALSLGLLEHSPPASSGVDSADHAVRMVEVMEEVARRRVGREVPRFDRGTTHVSVSDGWGNVASLTTSNGEGSGYLAPGTGIMLNNMMGEDDLHPEGFFASPPAERVASMMSPSVLLSGDRVRLVLGSGGSKRIRTALLQVISNVVDFDLGVRAAVERPRLHWDESRVQAEPGFPPAVIEALGGRWSVNEWPERNVYFGGVHAVTPQGAGAGDPRRGGDAEVVEARRG
jgi:gamma-glutamyltranspeptidase/glutathione hydrolase